MSYLTANSRPPPSVYLWQRPLGAGQLDLHTAGVKLIEEERDIAADALVRRRLPGRQAQFLYAGKRLADIIDLQTEVMQAGAIGFQPTVERVQLVQRLDQLQICVAQVKMGQQHRVVVDGLLCNNRKSELVAPYGQCFVCIGYHDSDVIEPG